MQLINFHPFMHRVRDSTASACFSRTNRILAAYFYLCSKLISLNRINSLSLHFAPRIPKVRRARICISDRASLPGIFRPPSFRHVMENAARVPLTMTASVFVRFFRERASERASSDGRCARTYLFLYPSRYVETDVYRRRSTGMPPLRLSLALSTPPDSAGHCVISVRHVPLVLGLAPNSGGFTHQTALGTLTRGPPLVDPTRLS